MWRRFVDRWPTPRDLAGAETQELLAAWAGLGYNRRALALREAARVIVADHEDRVPATVAELETMPGIGLYTARAIAAAAFGVPVAPLDVNVRRVVSRVLRVAASSAGLQAAADDLVSRQQPGRWFDAVMDLASGTCLSRAPRCDVCPLAPVCASRGAVVVAVERKTGSAPFPTTTRWLRGRLVATVTAAPDGGWVDVPDRLGTHGSADIVASVRDLEREGFVQMRGRRMRVRR
jgi:A/G-specific adenine glycosylase